MDEPGPEPYTEMEERQSEAPPRVGTVRRLFEVPPFAAEFTFGQLVAADGTGALLCSLEMVMTRYTVEQRKKQGFTRLAALIAQGMPEGDAKLYFESSVSDEMAAPLADWLGTMLPAPVELDDYFESEAAAGMALVRALRRVQASGSSTVVTAHEVRTAVNHYECILLSVGRDAAAAVIMGQLMELARSTLRTEVKTINLGHLGSIEAEILPLKAQLARKSGEGLPSGDILSYIAREVAEKRDEAKTASRSGDAQARPLPLRRPPWAMAAHWAMPRCSSPRCAIRSTAPSLGSCRTACSSSRSQAARPSSALSTSKLQTVGAARSPRPNSPSILCTIRRRAATRLLLQQQSRAPQQQPRDPPSSPSSCLGTPGVTLFFSEHKLSG